MDLHTFTDTQLMVLFRHGREEAFEILFVRHRERVFSMACRMTGRRADAEEAVQEVFLRVARAAPRYEPGAAFTTWLHRIVVNVCLNSVTRGDRGRIVSLDKVREAQEASAAPEDDPFGRLRAQEVGAALQEALGALPPSWRMALVMRVFENLPYREVGEALGIPEGTAKTYVHRARALLRRRLGRLVSPEMDKREVRR